MVYERNCFSGKTLRSISNVKIFFISETKLLGWAISCLRYRNKFSPR